MLAGFAGLTLAAGLAGLYLWQERRLKQRDAGVLRLRLPPLESLDRLSARTAFVSLVVLTAGIVVGLAQLRRAATSTSPMAVTLAIWALYAAGLLLRREMGLRGRRFARAARRRVRARRDRPPSDPLRLVRLALVGVSHRQAPVELRERVAVDADGAARARRAARPTAARRSCSRPATAPSSTSRATTRPSDLDERASASLLALAGDDGAALAPVLYRLGDDSAALHLFRVAAGLDSLVPGEGEILGQVRDAFEVGATGPLLDRLFRQALHAGRRARVETAIGESPASVPAAAAALAAAGLRRPRRPRRRCSSAPAR